MGKKAEHRQGGTTILSAVNNFLGHRKGVPVFDLCITHGRPVTLPDHLIVSIDSFLPTFIIFPLRFIRALFGFSRFVAWGPSSLSQKSDTLRVLPLIVWVLINFPIS